MAHLGPGSYAGKAERSWRAYKAFTRYIAAFLLIAGVCLAASAPTYAAVAAGFAVVMYGGRRVSRQVFRFSWRRAGVSEMSRTRVGPGRSQREYDRMAGLADDGAL